MAITKGRVASGGSVIFGRNSIDNIVESTENPNTYVTSGGKLLANYMDLQSDIGSASTDSEKAKAPTTGAVQDYVSSASTKVTAGYRLTFTGNTLDVDRYMPIETVDVSGASPSVTVMAGHAYKIMATNKQVTVNTETVDNDVFGLEGHAEIFVAGIGNIKLGQNIYFADALEPDSVNNCTIRFHDGKAIISVEDHIAGHVVTVNDTSGANTLNYWLSQPNTAGDDSTQYISFDASLDGKAINIGGATTYNAEKHVVGNGYTRTILTGDINCTSKTTFSDLGMSNVVVSSGTLTLGDAFIPSGSTVAVSGGGLAVEKVTGAGSESVIDLGYDSVTQTEGTRIDPTQGYFYGIKITNGNAGNIDVGKNQGGGLWLHNGNTIVSCNITGNKATYGGGIFALANTTNSISSSVVTNNTGTHGKDLAIQGGAAVTVVGSTIGDIALYNNAQISFSGSNSVDVIYPRSNSYLGSVTIASGATLDLTGNTNTTPIAPGGGITFASGGATVQLGATSGTVDSSYMMDNVTLPAGAKLTNTAVVDLGGTTTAKCYGSASGVTFYSGNLYVYGGTVDNITVNNGGKLYVYSSGTANEPIISSGGSLYVNSGGTALLVTSNTGAIVTVEDGGYITYKE